MTSLFHFIGLDTNQQAEHVWEGRYLTYRTEDNYLIALYDLGEFYAEIFYILKTNKISHIHGFRARSGLIPYSVDSR
ncbi:MAG: hypothetical protein JWQ79_2858 [Mucilaginibacter sp.]|jgi:hypothetical protein|nr:hypothetical protein [Mucilaginibacter sp.]